MMKMRRSLTEPDEINDLENAERIDDEERNEPTLLTVTRCVPKGEALYDDGPDRHYDDKRNKREQ